MSVIFLGAFVMSNLIKISKYAQNFRDIFASVRKGFYKKIGRNAGIIIRSICIITYCYIGGNTSTAAAFRGAV